MQGTGDDDLLNVKKDSNQIRTCKGTRADETFVNVQKYPNQIWMCKEADDDDFLTDKEGVQDGYDAVDNECWLRRAWVVTKAKPTGD